MCYGNLDVLNIPKQIEYWVRTAEEDFEVGSGLIHAGKTRHGLFFVHLAVEKTLKACVCKNQKATPPKTHNLMHLCRLAGLDVDIQRQDAIETLSRFCLEGRYPDQWPAIPEREEAQHYLGMAEELTQWLKKQL